MHRRRLAGVLAAVATTGAGCSLLVDFDVGVRDDADADAGADARCGSALALNDDFEAAALAAHWGAERQGDFIGDAAPVGGRLRFSFVGGGPPAFEYSAVVSRVAYDMRDTAVTVRAVTVDPIWETDLQLVAMLPVGQGEFVAGVGQYAGALRAWIVAPDVAGLQEIASTPYVAEDHVYWRAREVGGAIRFEAAGEDQQFGLITEVEDPRFTTDSLRIGLIASAIEPGSDGFVEFDDLNPGAPAVAMCPVDDLQDPFTSLQLGAQWLDRGPACTFTPTGASVVVSTPATSVCQLSSVKAYSLTGSAGLTMDIAAFPPDASVASELWLTSDEVTYAVVRQQGPQLLLWLFRNGVVDEQVLANPVASQRWRLSDAGGVVQVETAEPGGQFTPRGQIDPAGSIDLGAVVVGFSLSTGPTDASVELLGVNAP